MMLEQIWAALLRTTPLEAASVVLGLAYSVLAVRRSRWCWVAGGLSSAILVYLSARARLPMQSALQAYYVAMSFYGYWQWSRGGAGEARGGGDKYKNENKNSREDEEDGNAAKRGEAQG